MRKYILYSEVYGSKMQVADILQRRIQARKDASEEEFSNQGSGTSDHDGGNVTESDEEGDAPAVKDQVREDPAADL